MSRLETALRYSAMGWKIFPAYWTGKNHVGYVSWSKKSSDNLEQIKTWDKEFGPGMYFCVAAHQSGITILDVDRHGDKNGFESLSILKLLYEELPETLQCSTPGEGMHYHFQGCSAFSVDNLGPGLDLVVMSPIPGSHVPGKGDYKLVHDAPVAPIPTWLFELAGKPREKTKDRTPLVEADLPHNIDKAVEYLQSAEPALEGDGGDNWTYKVACGVRDLAISETLTLDLMLRYWNDRCLPPWDARELQKKVENAYLYSHSAPGERLPEADFDPIEEEAKEEDAGEDTQKLKFYDMAYFRKRGLTPPAWVIRKYFEMATTTLLYGDSGTFKSFLAMDIGFSVARGEDWAEQKIDQGPVFYIAGEGHGGIARRVEAYALHNNIPRDAQIPFFVANHSVQFDRLENVKNLVEVIKGMAAEHGKPKLLIIDTLATSFGDGNESDTKDMNRFLRLVNQALRGVLGCSVIIVHHTGHFEKNRPRGSYALMAGVDAYYRVERPAANPIADSMLVCLRRPGKMKDGEPPPDTWFKANVVKIGVDEDIEDITSLAITHIPEHIEPKTPRALGKNQAFIMGIIQGEGKMALETLQSRFQKWKEESGGKYIRQVFHDTYKNLEEKGILQRVGEELTTPDTCIQEGVSNYQ